MDAPSSPAERGQGAKGGVRRDVREGREACFPGVQFTAPATASNLQAPVSVDVAFIRCKVPVQPETNQLVAELVTLLEPTSSPQPSVGGEQMAVLPVIASVLTTMLMLTVWQRGHTSMAFTIPVRYDGFVLNPDARNAVVLEKFIDPLCPDCKQAWPVIQEVLEHYGPVLKFIGHPFPNP